MLTPSHEAIKPQIPAQNQTRGPKEQNQARPERSHGGGENAQGGRGSRRHRRRHWTSLRHHTHTGPQTDQGPRPHSDWSRCARETPRHAAPVWSEHRRHFPETVGETAVTTTDMTVAVQCE